MQMRVGSGAWKSGRLILGLALIGTSCDEGNPEGTNGDDSVELYSSPTPGTTAYEAENLTRTSSAIGTKVTSDGAASGGKYVEFNGTAASGAWMEFTLTNIAAGAYDVSFLYKSNNNRGIVQATLDGVNQGATCNEYAATVAYKIACTLGSKTLTAGNHTIRFTVTGKASGSSGYQMVVDQISLAARSGCTSPLPQFAQNPQSYSSPCNSTSWVSFTAAPSSGTTVSSVQWYVQYPGGAPFAPASTDKYHTGQTTFNLQVAPQSTQNVWCTITDTCGRTVSSSHALLTVPDPTCDVCYSGVGSSPAKSITVSGATPVCSGTSRTLAVSGGSLGAGAAWVWYANSSHVGSIGSGPSITVAPSSTTTYFVRAEGPCGNTSDVSTTISVYPPPQFAQNPQSYASPCNSTAWVSFTAAPSSGTVVSSAQWHVQFPGQPDFVPDSNARYWTGQNTLNLQIAPQDSQYVWCTITDICNVQVSSSHAMLSVPDPATCP
jgi:hypothetical protein